MTRVQSCVFAIPCGRTVDLFWQIFIVGYRDDDDNETTRGAAQSADSVGKRPLVGLSVGILHFTIPPNRDATIEEHKARDRPAST